MKNNDTLQNQNQDSNVLRQSSITINEVSPEANHLKTGAERFIGDLKAGSNLSSRINVQIDWLKGRMAVSY